MYETMCVYALSVSLTAVFRRKTQLVPKGVKNLAGYQRLAKSGSFTYLNIRTAFH